MHRTRWLILTAISIIVVAVGYTYFTRLQIAAKELPSKPKPLPPGIDATAQGWHLRNSAGNCPTSEIKAKNLRQVTEPSTFELEGVDLLLFHDCGAKFDHVTSAKAQFDISTGLLYSEGDVDITMSVPEDGKPAGRMLKIHSSGVKFETKAGKASTDKAASFSFEGGDGTCVGAEYDPNTRELQMRSKVELFWRGKKKGGPVTKIESEFVSYKERDHTVMMQPWAKMTRGTLTFNSGPALATLEDQQLRKVDAQNAFGVQDEPGRKVEYEAEALTVSLDDDQQINRIEAERRAHLVSTTATGRMEVRSDRLDLAFEVVNKESTLTRALATGHGVVNSTPIVKPPALMPESRILKSEFIEMHMRPGGKEIEKVDTAAGSIEFVPNRPGQPHRVMTGDKIWLIYGPENHLQKMTSVNVVTRTDNPAKQGKPQPPSITSSVELHADFDPKTHQLARVEQNTNFRYEEGDRKAQANKATLEQAKDLMTLSGTARVSDPGGSAAADQIVMNQKTGDFTAEGHVSSTRLPEKKGQSSSAMLNNDEPLQAKANRMVSADGQAKIRYEGNAIAWQGANRVQADVLDIDRDESIMKASGNVVSQFVDKPKKDKTGKPLPNQTSVFTVVRAPEMTYTEEKRTAVYTGGVTLHRPDLNVKSRELTAYLKDKDSDSSLDKALADGAVVIIQNSPGRVRTGTAEHSEYYASESKIILEKGRPKLVDTVDGVTEGEKLTYFADDDRLLINGSERQRAQSVIRRKRK